jgi:FtsP/CotA-like multicopper oxidase with cupredoxin domain
VLLKGNPSAASLQVDFRDPNTKGEFVYRCHILEHEDGGMMGKILVNY